MGDKTVLAFGSLLHDVGKVVYRGFSGAGTHSVLGAAFLSDDIASVNASFATDEGRAVIEQVRYHHKGEMQYASLPRDSLAFITYFADNVSAGMDRKCEGDEKGPAVFDKGVDLRKIFNIVWGHRDDNTIPHNNYNVIREQIKLQLLQTHISPLEINSLINCLEATCSTVPSSTDLSELVDVSLYDHAKTTAGIASCLYDYLQAAGVTDYEYALFGKGAVSYYGKPMFLLYSCDMSGIQDFIYNISGSGALKQLRARSLYLEMLLEHMADELLERLELSRANLLYTGGGHAYFLLPNTAAARRTLGSFHEQIKEWFLSHYGTDLFLASAWVECSPEDLKNKGNNKQRFPQLFRDLSSKMSAAKALRYSAEDIRRLNFGKAEMGDARRECRECHRSDALAADGDIRSSTLNLPLSATLNNPKPREGTEACLRGSLIPLSSLASNALICVVAVSLPLSSSSFVKKGDDSIVPLSAVKDRNTLVLASVNLLHNLGAMAITFFVPGFAMMQLANDPIVTAIGPALASALAAVLLALLGLVLGPAFGKMIARGGSAKRALTMGNIVRIVAMVALLFVLVPGTPVWVICLIVFAAGFCDCNNSVAMSAGPQIQLKPEFRVAGNSVIQLGQNLGAGIGAALFAYLVGLDPVNGMNTCIMVALACYVAIFFHLLTTEKRRSCGSLACRTGELSTRVRGLRWRVAVSSRECQLGSPCFFESESASRYQVGGCILCRKRQRIARGGLWPQKTT